MFNMKEIKRSMLLAYAFMLELSEMEYRFLDAGGFDLEALTCYEAKAKIFMQYLLDKQNGKEDIEVTIH